MSLLIEQPRHFFIVLNINTEAANYSGVHVEVEPDAYIDREEMTSGH